MGNYSLWVFLDGALMQKDLDYLEKDNTSVTFTSEIKKGQTITLVPHTSLSKSREVLTSDKLNGVYVLPSGKSYLSGNYIIDVFVDGIRQTEKVDYVESDLTTIKFGYPLYKGQEVAIILSV